ncbi:MAG: hypothetical protein ACXVFQ_03770 [Solirubrobacteraceae bacterium]
MAVDASSLTRRMPAVRFRLSPDTGAMLAIGLAVLAANLPFWSGFFDPNPLHFRSGLTSSLTAGPLHGRPTIDPSNGFTSQAIGHRAALDVLDLDLPWWNPYEGTGMPLLGETQSAALFPPTLLTALSNGQLYEHMLLELVAGICTYLLLRRILVARSAALAGGVAFALCGKFAWFSDAGVNPLPFLPMLLLGIELAFEATRAGQRAGWRLIAVAGALSVYAGFPEVAYIDTLMPVFWVGWRCACLERAQLRPFLAKVVLGAVAGMLIAAPMLLAMFDYLRHADLGGHAGSRFGSRHLGPSALPQLVLPYVYGQVSAHPRAPIWVRVGGYLSVTLLLLATLGVLARDRRGLKAVLLGCAVLVFARMYGVPLLGHVLGVLPGMYKIQFYRYGTAALELPIIILAALGLDDLARVPEHRRRLVWGALGAVALVVGAAFGARPVVRAFGSRFHENAFFWTSVAWATTIAVAVAAVAFIRSPRVRAGLLALLVSVEAIALFVVPEFSAPRMARIDLAPVAYLHRHLGLGRFYTLGPISPDYGSYFGLASVGVDDFPPKDYAAYVHSRLDPDAGFTGFPARRRAVVSDLLHHLGGYRSVGVRYVLAPAWESLPQRPKTLRLVFRSPSTRIYRLAGAAPYYQAPGCQVISTSSDSVSVTCPRPTTLVRRETWFDGWTARVNGKPARIRRIDGLFQGVTVPAGTHRLTFSFLPPGMSWAAIGLLAGCALLCLPTVSGMLRRRQNRA